jgi:hypothetical protein
VVRGNSVKGLSKKRGNLMVEERIFGRLVSKFIYSSVKKIFLPGLSFVHVMLWKIA